MSTITNSSGVLELGVLLRDRIEAIRMFRKEFAEIVRTTDAGIRLYRRS